MIDDCRDLTIDRLGYGALAFVFVHTGNRVRAGDSYTAPPDADGEIHVYEDQRFRYLTFGNAVVEQSCFDSSQPCQPQHVYPGDDAGVVAAPRNPRWCRSDSVAAVRPPMRCRPASADLGDVERAACVIDVQSAISTR